MPFQGQDGESKKRVCTLATPVKRIQDSGQSLFSGRELCESQKLETRSRTGFDTTHFEGLRQTGQLPQLMTLVSDFEPTKLMFGATTLGAGGLRHSPPPPKGPANNNHGDGNGFNNTGDGGGGGKGGGGGGTGGENGPQS